MVVLPVVLLPGAAKATATAPPPPRGRATPPPCAARPPSGRLRRVLSGLSWFMVLSLCNVCISCLGHAPSACCATSERRTLTTTLQLHRTTQQANTNTTTYPPRSQRALRGLGAAQRRPTYYIEFSCDFGIGSIAKYRGFVVQHSNTRELAKHCGCAFQR